MRRIVATSRSPAHLIELYYWSLEPELIGTVRHIVSLPDEPRDALRAFLTMTADCPETVQVSVSQEGHVTLYSTAVAEIMQETMTAPGNDELVKSVH